MLATPMVGTVMAGKGQEKLDFELYMVGAFDGLNMDRFVAADGVWHFFGWVWVITGDYYIVVDGVTYYPTDYYGTLDVHANLKTGVTTVQVRETITLDGGTLEIVSTENGVPGGFANSFVGHGTGAFKGVKVQGTSNIIGVITQTVTRTGTVMGWPTP